ncbi:hypothetical protein QJS66_03520 [Kocuria rhizophila]|nr:hypothetical protein QJS66_03520 [Kocuria rhizophila]
MSWRIALWAFEQAWGTSGRDRRDGQVDPVHRHARGGLPGRAGLPDHRHRGPGHAPPQRQRVPARGTSCTP